MANPWFRMYSEFAFDPKVQMLSETDQRRYIMLLCLRCSNGDVTLHETAVAFQLRISDSEWATTKQTLVTAGLIDKHNKPVAWDKRQYASDTSRERVAKHREKKKRESNADVTLQKQQTNAVDSDTDIDTEKNNSKDRRAPRFDAVAELLGRGVVGSVAADWLMHRKAKKAAVTKTVIDGLEAEAKKAGVPLPDALAMCCQRGWTGFKAEWVIGERRAPANGRQAHLDNYAASAAAARGEGYESNASELDITGQSFRLD